MDARERFEGAFVATLYLLGLRGDAFDAYELGPTANALTRVLRSPDKETRALGLAREMARIGLALDRGVIE